MFPELLNEVRRESWFFADYRPRISQNGRCLRCAVYDRLGYQEEKEPLDPESIAKMEEGRLHEEDIKQKFALLGCPPMDCQRDILIPAKTHTGLIKGKIDFCIWIDETGLEHIRQRGIPVPEFVTAGKKLVEAKSISRAGFDFLGEKPMEAHEAQAITYLHKLIEEGVYQALVLYKCRDTGRWKEYWLQYDPEIVIQAMEKFEQVESHAQSGTLPPRVTADPDLYPCSHCEFQELCWSTFEEELLAARHAPLPEEITAKIDRYQQVKKEWSASNNEKESLSKEIKLWMAKNNICSGTTPLYNVAIKIQDRPGHIVPPSKPLVLEIKPLAKSKSRQAKNRARKNGSSGAIEPVSPTSAPVAD